MANADCLSEAGASRVVLCALEIKGVVEHAPLPTVQHSNGISSTLCKLHPLSAPLSRCRVVNGISCLDLIGGVQCHGATEGYWSVQEG